MIISDTVARAFNKAVTNPENIETNGSINWNFAEADAFMDSGEDHSVTFFDQFDFLACCFTGQITLADRLKQNLVMEKHLADQ